MFLCLIRLPYCFLNVRSEDFRVQITFKRKGPLSLNLPANEYQKHISYKRELTSETQHFDNQAESADPPHKYLLQKIDVENLYRLVRYLSACASAHATCIIPVARKLFLWAGYAANAEMEQAKCREREKSLQLHHHSAALMSAGSLINK